MHGQTGPNPPPYARLPPQFTWHGCMDDLTTERSLDSQVTSVNDALGLFFDMFIHGCVFSQALADVRSTGAYIKCLHCSLPGTMFCLRRRGLNISALM